MHRAIATLTSLSMLSSFKPQRNPKHHLAFGRGSHLCPGATLARTELRILLEELLNAHPPFELASEAVWSHMEGGHHMGVARLPVKFLDHVSWGMTVSL